MGLDFFFFQTLLLPHSPPLFLQEFRNYFIKASHMTSRWWLKKKNPTIFLLIQLQVGHATCQHISRTSVSVSSEIVSIAGLHMNGKCLLINNKYLHVQYLISFLSKHQHKNLLSSGRSSSFNCSLNELDYPKCKLSTSDDSSSSHILI